MPGTLSVSSAIFQRHFFLQVCFNCSDLGNQQFGETRSLTEFFVKARESRRINARQELCRLVDGFKANVKASRLDSVMTETFSNIKVPIWQKSYKWLVSEFKTSLELPLNKPFYQCCLAHHKAG